MEKDYAPWIQRRDIPFTNCWTEEEGKKWEGLKERFEKETCFIKDVNIRQATAETFLKEMEELVYRLSVQCGYETVSMSFPIKGQLPTASHSGMHSLDGVKALMRKRFDREVYALSITQQNLKVMSKSDIEHVTKAYFILLSEKVWYIFLSEIIIKLFLIMDCRLFDYRLG